MAAVLLKLIARPAINFNCEKKRIPTGKRVGIIKNRIRSLLKRPFVHDTLLTSVLVVGGKAIGIMVPFFIAAWFGADNTVDSFFLAYSIIIFIAGIFGTTMSKVIVPYIIELKRSREKIGKFITSILIMSTLFYIILLTLGTFIIKEILIITTKFDSAGLNSISLFILEMVPFVFLLICSNTLDGVLNALKKFTLPAITPAIRSLVIVGMTFLLKDRVGIHSIVVGYIIGELCRLLVLFLIMKKKQVMDFSFSFSFNPKLLDFMKKGLYQVIAMVLFGINPLVDKTMASWKGTGSVSILYYADRIYLIPVHFLVSGFLVTLLSYISGNLYTENKSKFKKLIHKAAKAASIAVLFITIPGILLYKPVIAFVFSIGTLEPEIITGIQNVFLGYFISLFPYILSQVYGHGLIAIKKTKIIMFLSMTTFILNIILNLFLMEIAGLPGLALSTSIIRVINCITYMVSFYVYYKKLE